MIPRSDVGVALVTRGDVDLQPILAALPFEQVAVWDNSMEAEDLGVYGRYAAAAFLTSPVVLTQDDDVMLPARTISALLAAYRPGVVVCNVPAVFRPRYHDSGLLGFGAIFDRDLPAQAFERFQAAAGKYDPDWFRRTCDLVLTMLAPMTMVDLPYTELEQAHAENRMWKQNGHFEEREAMRELCRRIRDAD